MFKTIVKSSRELRRNATPAETYLWTFLRNRQLEGYKFLRQHPLKFQYEDDWRFFVADFYCAEQKLVVEIDGEIHKKLNEQDEYRTQLINTMGCTVVRFSNKQVIDDCESVLTRILMELTPSVPLSNQ